MNKKINCKLSQLLNGYAEIPENSDTPVSGLSIDSRTLSEGAVFFAYPGGQSDGRAFINDALSKKPAAIVYEANNASSIPVNTQIPCFPITNVQSHLSAIAARFYGNPSKDMTVIGITGTNGKTTCSHLMAAALHVKDKPAGVIGTLGHGICGDLQEGTHTTPDAITTQRILFELKQKGVKTVTMEVSSHALTQHRVADVNFSIGVFTNLTRDHLDYHPDMVAYGQAKRRLFTEFKLDYGIINADDPYGNNWLKQLHTQMPLVSYSIDPPKGLPNTIQSVYTKHVHLTTTGIRAEVVTPWGVGLLQSHLLGRFNLSNLLAIITALGVQGIPLSEILARIAHLKPVAGRLESLAYPEKPLVIVDFAHTPDALEQTLLTIKEFSQGKLWCVFGCGGDRDRGKRSLMGQVAEKLADYVVLTDDNPRNENPQDILAEIMQGFDHPKKVVIEHDRQKAIEHSILSADKNDIIVIAGKGHEQYQEIKNNKIPFNDLLVAKQVLL